MADTHFFHKIPHLSLAEIAKIGNLTLPQGIDENQLFSDVASLDTATKSDISWAFIPSIRDMLAKTGAGAVIVPEKFASFVPKGCIALISADAHASYGLVAAAFYPREIKHAISDRATIHPTAKMGANCQIMAGAYIGENVNIGDNCTIHPNAVIEQGVKLGNNCLIGANACVSHCVAGDNVYIYPGCMIGQDGFGFAMSANGPVKVPQLGRVMIGNDVEIGSNTTVDRGAMGDTVIGDGCRIDNLVQIAHNVKLGKCCVIVSQVGIAGSCTFGDFVVAGGQVGFAGHLKIGAGAQIAAQSGIMHNVEPGSILMGSPAMPKTAYMRLQIAIKRLVKQI